MEQPASSAVESPPKTPRPLRIGVVGCGFQGSALARAAAATSAVSLVACADPDAGAAASIAALAPDISSHSSIDALLDQAEVDAVLVATPHHLLCPLALAAIRAGKHVLAEKPIGLNEQEAATIEREAAHFGVRFMAGYSCRFWPGGHVRDLLTAGVVGDIQAVTGLFACEPLDDGWLGSTDSGGGPLLHLGSHLVDMVLWFVGDNAVEVSGSVTRRADNGTDGTSAFQILFGRGTIAQCLVTQAASAFFFTVDVVGNAGRVMLRGWHWLQFEIEVSSTVTVAYAQPTVISPYIASDHIAMMLVPELEEFAGAIVEGRMPAITAADGRRTLQVLDAVVAADRLGSSVTIK